MKRTIKLAALILMAALLLTGCLDFSAPTGQVEDPEATPLPTMPPLTDPLYEDYDALYRMYNEVKVGDHLDDLIERYGQPELQEDGNGTTYVWKDEAGYGVAAVFFENNCLRAKVLTYEDIRQLKGLCGATGIDNVALLKQDDTFSMVCLAMNGKPMEIAAIAQDSSVNPEVKRLFAWVDADGSFAQVLFGSDEKLEEVSFYFAEAAEEAEN